METFRNKISCFKDLKVTADAIALTRGSEVLSAIDKRPGTVAITNMGSTFKEHATHQGVSDQQRDPFPRNGA